MGWRLTGMGWAAGLVNKPRELLVNLGPLVVVLALASGWVTSIAGGLVALGALMVIRVEHLRALRTDRVAKTEKST